MAEKSKRYSIIRVDNYRCIKALERIRWNCGCFKSCGACQKKYGDTKKQLIKKVEQELTRQVFQNNFRLKDIATKIIEFLGVK